MQKAFLKKIRKIFPGFLIGSILTLFAVISLYTNIFFLWHQRLSDTLFLTRKPCQQIVIIAIDDFSIQKIGRWPWDRSVHARLINKLSQANTAVIGVDVSFSEPSTETQDTQLEKAVLNSQTPVILAAESQELKITTTGIKTKNITKPLPRLRSDPPNFGIVNMIPDKDGVIRHTPIRITTKEETLDNFSLAILKVFYKKQENLNFNQKLTQIKTDRNVLRINFAGPPNTFTTYSVNDVLNNKIENSRLKNKIVLIGATAQNLHDSGITPTSGKPMSGVEIHANVLGTLIEERFLMQESKTKTIAFIAAFAMGLSMLFTLLPLAGVAAATIISLLAYYIFSFISFDYGIIRHLLYAPLVIILSAIVNTGYKYLTEQKQKLFIKKAMGRYLSPTIMQEVLSNPKKLQLGGKRKKLTVLFSDIADFTTISEKLPAEVLADLLNQYLTKMTKTVFDNFGVLDKYIGDAIMAFWGAPLKDKLHAWHACQTALQMQKVTKEMSSIWKQKGISKFHIRIGVHTGEMVVGNMGSNQRFDYTLLGDNVNLGSRIEGINKLYGTKIIISNSTRRHIKDKIVTRKLDTVAVKGKSRGVLIYELRRLGKPTQKEKLFITKFEKARLLYEKGFFAKARKAFKKLEKSYPNDGPIKTYINRCKKLEKNPPKKWDGTYRATKK